MGKKLKKVKNIKEKGNTNTNNKTTRRPWGPGPRNETRCCQLAMNGYITVTFPNFCSINLPLLQTAHATKPREGKIQRDLRLNKS